MRNTSFEGVTGPVRFYDNERKASILLKQFQDGEEVKVGEYSAATQHLDLTLGEPLKWIGRYTGCFEVSFYKLCEALLKINHKLIYYMENAELKAYTVFMRENMTGNVATAEKIVYTY